MPAKRGLHTLLVSSAAIQATGLFVITLLGIVLARFLGPTAYGQYGLAMSVVALACIPAQFGLPLLATREAAAAVSNTRRSVLSWFFQRSAIVSMVVGVALLAGLVAYKPAWASGDMRILVLCSILVCAMPVLAVLAALLRGFGANLTGQILDLVAKPSLVVTWVYGATLMVSLGVGSALTGQVIATILCIFVAVILLARVTQNRDKETFPNYLPRGWIPVAASFMSNSWLGALNGHYPLLIAGAFFSGDHIGVFRVALSSAALLSLPTAIVNIAASPEVAREYARSDWIALSRTTSHTTVASFFLTMAGFILIVLFGDKLIYFLFGREYVGAYIPILILGVGQLIISAFGLSGTYLNLTGHHKIVMQAFLLSVPLGFLSSIVLTPILGINGAATGTVVMATVWHIYIFIFKSRYVAAPLSLFAAVKTIRSLRKI